MQVLVADDDPTYRTLFRELLQEWHFGLTLAVDGTEAWEVLQRPDAPRLVLLDWMMPGLDGFEVCKKVRAEPGGRDTYILIVTGTRKKQDLLRVVVAGADDYLIKPFEPMDLKIRLRAAKRILDLEAEVAELGRLAGARV